MDWVKILMIALGGGTVSIVLKAIIDWARFNKKDNVEEERTAAESEKLRAEALETKARAEVSVSEAALKLAQRISEECESTRVSLIHTQEELSKTLTSLNETTQQLQMLKEELIEERARAEANQKEVERLKLEISKLRK